VRILGIETSGPDGSVALVRDDQVVSERRLATANRRHAQTLLSEVHSLLESNALRPSQIDAVAVSLGPGSFTGLRVGVVCAKTWAYATGCRAIGVETFAAFAAQAPSDWAQVWVIGDAQRGDFFAAEYRREDAGAWKSTVPVAIVPGAIWLSARSASDRIIGPGVSRVTEGSTSAVIVREDWALRPSASALARLGWERLRLGQSDDVWTLAPLYIRPSAAEEKHLNLRSL
jgi:tRNA threonylcarbamoyladenosine biosynthesis protein TsaB